MLLRKLYEHLTSPACLLLYTQLCGAVYFILLPNVLSKSESLQFPFLRLGLHGLGPVEWWFSCPCDNPFFFGLYFANTKDVAVVYRSFLSLLYIMLLWGLVIFCFIWQHVRNIMKINSRTLYKCFSDKIIFMEIQRANKFS